MSDQGHHTDYAELRADLAEASNAVEIAAALSKHTPPSDRVKREIVRGLLKRTIGERLKAVGDNGTSATGLTDAWLKSSNGDGADLQGEAFKPDEVEAWAEPVDLGEVLDEAVAAISRYLYAPEASIDAIALWCAYTYAYDEFDVSPILDVFSPTKRCGKTTALTCVRRLAREAMMAGNISPAALTRSVSRWHPTLIADEADTFAVANDEIRGIYNSGHTRETAYVVRAEGDNNEPRMLNTYSPKAIGCIGHLPDTIRDRAVTVELRRKPTTAVREDANDVKATRAEFDPIRARLVRAIADVVQHIPHVEVERPDGLNDRAWNNAKPLLTVAALAGEAWLARATEAIVALADEDEEADENLLALRHVYEILRDEDDGKATTEAILQRLVERDDADWARYWARSVTGDFTEYLRPSSQLAKYLRPFGIKPTTIRTLNGVAKGYRLDDFLKPDVRPYLDEGPVADW